MRRMLGILVVALLAGFAANTAHAASAGGGRTDVLLAKWPALLHQIAGYKDGHYGGSKDYYAPPRGSSFCALQCNQCNSWCDWRYLQRCDGPLCNRLAGLPCDQTWCEKQYRHCTFRCKEDRCKYCRFD